jgi:hypothetical protein
VCVTVVSVVVVGFVGAFMTEVLPRTCVGTGKASSVDVSVSSGLRTPSVCRMLVEAPLVAGNPGVESTASGLPIVKVGMTMEIMKAEENVEEEDNSFEGGAATTVVKPETVFAPLVRVTVEDSKTTVCRVEVEETTTSVIDGCMVMVVLSGLVVGDGETVIVVP